MLDRKTFDCHPEYFHEMADCFTTLKSRGIASKMTISRTHSAPSRKFLLLFCSVAPNALILVVNRNIRTASLSRHNFGTL